MTDPEGGASAELRGTVRILGGDPTDEELAAVTAVLTAALDQLATEERTRDPGTTSWQRSQRRMREPLTPGAWVGFGR